jgi:hypothetical protein
MKRLFVLRNVLTLAVVIGFCQNRSGGRCESLGSSVRSKIRSFVLMIRLDCGFCSKKGALGATFLNLTFCLYLSSECAARGMKHLLFL